MSSRPWKLWLGAGLLGAAALLYFFALPSGDEGAEPRSEGRSASSSPLFIDRARELGLSFEHRNGAAGEFHIAETLGSGVGVIDYDGDGDLDVYAIQGGPLLGSPRNPDLPNRLFRNEGGRFVDVTEQAGVGHTGYGMGAAVADYDGDGHQDLFVTNWGPDVLYRNRGDGTFEDVTEAAGLADSGFATSAAWLDLEGDGDLDLYVCHYVVSPDAASAPWCGRRNEGLRFACHPGAFPAEPDHLYRNLGDGTFEDVSEASGVAASVPGRGLGVVGTDFDQDGDVDLYVANDTTENFLFENQGDGSFKDVGALVGVAYNSLGQSEAGMGVDAADCDGDGLIDLFVTNLSGETNTLYGQDEERFFLDRTRQRGLAEASVQYVGFGTRFFDADLDGDLDLMVANGHVIENVDQVQPMYTFRQPDLFFENDGRGFFTAREGFAAIEGGPAVGRGIATVDLDDDGDLDVLLSNNGGPLWYLENQAATSGRHWIGLELVGPPGNREAFGARVELKLGERTLRQEVRSGSSFLCSHDLRVHFGLGERTAVDEATVHWPDGRTSTLREPALDRYHRIVPGE